MHRIDHATAVNSHFVNGSSVSGQKATVVTADIMNAFQDEIASVIETAGLSLNKQDNTQLYNAINKIIALNTIIQPIGKIEMLPELITPSADNPRFCLSNADVVLNAANWPDLVPYLRGIKLAVATTKDFPVISYSRTSNVITLQLDNNSDINKVLAALYEDYLVHGSYTNWQTVYVPAFGTVTAGDYAITEVDTANRRIKFAHSGSDVTSTVISININFYRHRVATATDPTGVQARHFAVTGRTLMTPNDTDGYYVAGLRRRDRMQGHIHSMGMGSGYNDGNAGSYNSARTNATGMNTGSPATDGTNGTPRTGKYNEPNSFTVYPYIWGRRYVP